MEPNEAIKDDMLRIKRLLEQYAEGDQERGEDLTLTEIYEIVDSVIEFLEDKSKP